MVIFHSYVSLPEGKSYHLMVIFHFASCQKKTAIPGHLPDIVGHDRYDTDGNRHSRLDFEMVTPWLHGEKKPLFLVVFI